MPHVRRAPRLWVGLAVFVAGVACETARNPGGIQFDTQPPVITLAATADTQQISAGLQFVVNAVDNLGLKRITLTYSGGLSQTDDTVFTSAVTEVNLTKLLTFPATTPVGGLVQIVGRALDGNGNQAFDTLFVFLSNVNALQVVLLAPTAPAVASPGLYIPVTVQATQNTGVRKIGWIASTTPVQTAQTADSLTFSLPYSDSIVFVDSVLVTGTSGNFVLQGFAEDSAGRPGTSNTVTVGIQSAATDNTPPQVQHTVALRVEVNDTITVHATDPSGIRSIGFEIRSLAGALLRTPDSIVFTSTPLTTDRTVKFSMNLAAVVTVPGQVVINGFAWDGATTPNRGVSTVGFIAAGTAVRDTLTVVAGITRLLPGGGQIMDMAVNANQNEIYMTNILRDRLEVFTLVGDSFLTGALPNGIPTGSRPWGIALWPRDNTGAYADTVVVANSGGTNLSIVDVTPAARRERRRHRLPNFLVQRIQTQLDQGQVKIKIEEFDLSDRPQFVALTRSGANVIAVYSTAPTASQADPFGLRGTVRWENLDTTVAIPSHFFWEHAGAAANPDATDTLQIILDRPWKPPFDPLQTDTVVCAATGEIVDFTEIAFADTTFTRNSGDFTHAFIGEGENVGSRFARVMNYRPGVGVVSQLDSADLDGDLVTDVICTTETDFGISPAIRVSDFISNTATRVRGIAINFNGLTNMVRTTDSIYVLGEDLRLGGTVQNTGANAGMDLHPAHAFNGNALDGETPFYGGTRDPNTRLVYASSTEPKIDVYDTYRFAPVTSVPIRDPVIGPLRIANVGGTQILVGVTVRGVVTVRLPAVANIFPAYYRPYIAAGGAAAPRAGP